MRLSKGITGTILNVFLAMSIRKKIKIKCSATRLDVATNKHSGNKITHVFYLITRTVSTLLTHPKLLQYMTITARPSQRYRSFSSPFPLPPPHPPAAAPMRRRPSLGAVPSVAAPERGTRPRCRTKRSTRAAGDLRKDRALVSSRRGGYSRFT